MTAKVTKTNIKTPTKKFYVVTARSTISTTTVENTPDLRRGVFLFVSNR